MGNTTAGRLDQLHRERLKHVGRLEFADAILDRMREEMHEGCRDLKRNMIVELNKLAGDQDLPLLRAIADELDTKRETLEAAIGGALDAVQALEEYLKLLAVPDLPP